MPRKILNLELSSQCCARCVYCVQSECERDDAFLPWDIVREAIDQAADLGFTELHPQMWGEPTEEYGNLAKAIVRARERGMIVVVYSNAGNAPLYDLPERVPHSMRWSLNAHNADVLKRVSPGLVWEDVYANVTAWWEAHGHLAPFHEIVARITRCRENEHDVEAIKAFWSPFVHKVAVVPEFPLRRSIGEWPVDEDYLCRAGEDTLAVLSDGRVVGCCVDQEGEILLGRLPEQSLADILQGPCMREFRQRMKERHWYGICKRCGFRDRRRKA